MRRIIVTLLIVLAALSAITAGCSMNRPKVATAPYHEQSMYNFYLGRLYLAEGRYELARERFVTAMAAADNEEMRLLTAQELDMVEKMIQSRR